MCISRRTATLLSMFFSERRRVGNPFDNQRSTSTGLMHPTAIFLQGLSYRCYASHALDGEEQVPR